MIADLRTLRSQMARMIQQVDLILSECDAAPTGADLRNPIDCERAKSVSLHALSRYRERTGTQKSDQTVCNRITEQLMRAQPMRLKPEFMAIEMINHGIHANYWRLGDLMFVVENEVVVTVHRGEADRWIAA